MKQRTNANTPNMDELAGSASMGRGPMSSASSSASTADSRPPKTKKDGGLYKEGLATNGLVADGPAAENASTIGSMRSQREEDDVDAMLLEAGGAKSVEPELTFKDRLYIGGSFVFNFVAAIGIIWSNKWVVDNGFKWMTVLTWFHFVTTFVSLETGAQLKFFEKKRKSVWIMAPICIAFAGYVVFGNLSLKYNTISIYQLLKVATTPVLCVLQSAIYGMHLTVLQWLSLIPVCVGVGIATVSGFEMSGILGMVFGVIAILVTAIYSIWIKTQQDDLAMSPVQLLLNQAMYSCMILLPICLLVDYDILTCLLFDRTTYFADAKKSAADMAGDCKRMWAPLHGHGAILAAAVCLSCFFAVGVNISTFMVVGKTSPATFAIVSQGKLICILLSGFLFFGDKVTVPALIGSSLAVLGVCMYSVCKAYGV